MNEFDLQALALALYDGDIEASQGAPEGARHLRDAFAATDALLLVNAAGDQRVRLALAPTAGKPVDLMSASPG